MPANGTRLPNLFTVPPGYAIPNQEALDLGNLAAWHFERLGQMGYLAAPPEGSLSQPLGMPSNPAWTSRRVWKDEPPGSIPFDEQASTALPLATLGVDFVVLQFQVPYGFDGVIRWISNNLLPEGTFTPGALVWKILVNRRAVRNFANITQEKGTVFQGREVSPIRIFSGDIVQYTVDQPIGSTLTGTVVVSATGYYFPSKGIS
jgi:hypothetical protein